MCPGLSRQLIGDLLGENNERCLRVLECFTASFDFTGADPISLYLHQFLYAQLAEAQCTNKNSNCQKGLFLLNAKGLVHTSSI